MVRVIAGSARGTRLAAPKGRSTRPTADRIKETLFNILGDAVVDARALDLFAGTGALGIEALSRGASSAVFVEADPRCSAVLEQNLRKAKVEDRAIVARARLPAARRRVEAAGPYDVVFADPPYDEGHVEETLLWLDRSELVAGGGWVALERSPKEETPSNLAKLELLREKVFKETVLSIFRAIG